MKLIPTNRRFVFKDVPLTGAEREELKREHIAEAMRWIPPTTRTEQVEVKPDDPRYKDAPISEDWIVSPAFKTCIPRKGRPYPVE